MEKPPVYHARQLRLRFDMATTTKLMTAEELLEMPDDGFRYELVRGELVKMPPAGHMSSFREMLIGSHLTVYVRENRLGRAYGASGGFRLESDPDTVLAPDAAFVRQERVEAVGDGDGFFPRRTRPCWAR